MEHKRGEIIIFENSSALAEEGARRFMLLAGEAIQNRGSFDVALAGGTTPKAMYRLLADSTRKDIQWNKIYIFWGDERFVRPNDPDSTYSMVNEVLLKPACIPERNVFPVPTTNCSLEEAAERYSASLVNHAGTALPRLDLVLLGMGPDGHTASLFPGSNTLNSGSLVATERNSPKPPSERITMTYKLINNAANVIFLITGADKAHSLKMALGGTEDFSQLPARGVKPTNGKLLWLVDAAAASALRQ